MRSALSVTAILLSPLLIARADELLLNNGDRLSGKVQINSGIIILVSDVLGELKIPAIEVRTVKLQEPQVLAVADSAYNALNIEVDHDTASIATESGEKIRAAVSTIRSTTIMPKASVQNSELASRFSSASWDIGFATGFTAARGNKSINNLNFSVTTSRSSDHSRVTLSLNSLLTETGTVTQPGTLTNVIRSGAHYEHNVTPALFAFAMTNFDVDQQQQLDLRSVLGAGLGCRVADGPGATLDVFGGTSFNREAFSTTEDRVSGELLAGQTFTYKPAEQVVFSERFTIFPNFTNRGDFRFTFDSTALMKLNKWLGWETKLNQVFLSNPPLLAQRNDVIITTGLRLTYDRDGAKFSPRSSVGPFDEKKR